MSRKAAAVAAFLVISLMLAAMVFVSSESIKKDPCLQNTPLPMQVGAAGTLAQDGLTVGGKKIKSHQAVIATQIIAIGIERGLSARDILTALMVATQESRIKNLKYGDRDSLGVFQQRTSQGWGTVAQILNPIYAINKFYEVLETVPNREMLSLLDVALAVQRPSLAAYTSLDNYFPGWEAESKWLLEAYSKENGTITAPVSSTADCVDAYEDSVELMVQAALSRQGEPYYWEDSTNAQLISWAAREAGFALPGSIEKLYDFKGDKSEGVSVQRLEPEDITSASSLRRGDLFFEDTDGDGAVDTSGIVSGQGGPGAGTQLRLATYNITVKQQYADYPKVVSNIKDTYKLDIVGTQELENENYRIIQREMTRDGTFGIYPDKKSGDRIVRHGLNARSILYRADRFKLDESRSTFFRHPRYAEDGPAQSGDEQILAGQANVPVAFFNDTATGQPLIVINFHNAAFKENAERRYLSNLIIVEQIEKLSQDNPGVPIFLTGDFNEGTGVRGAGDGANYTFQQRSENLLYCMFAKNGLMTSTEAESRGQATTCPNPQPGGVDYIYASPDVAVVGGSFTEIPRGVSGSDHPAKFVDVQVPGTTQTAPKGIAAKWLSTTIGREAGTVALTVTDSRKIVRALRLTVANSGIAEGWKFPLTKGVYTYTINSYGPRDLGDDDWHNGTDFGTNGGTPPLVAMHGGEIVAWGYAGAWGNHLIVETGVPVPGLPGATYKYLYAHLSSYAPGINTGKSVEVGQLVGYVGDTGNSFGEHLHLTICTTMACTDGNEEGSTDPIPFLALLGIVP